MYIHIEDPVVVKEANVPNSLTKMLMDLFSHSTTASLFYTNDLLVVIDIITRQLSDLNPDDKVTNMPEFTCFIRTQVSSPACTISSYIRIYPHTAHEYSNHF